MVINFYNKVVNIEKINYLLLLLFILLFHIVINYQILKSSQVLRAYDEPLYIGDGFFYYETIFSNPGISTAQRIDRLFIKADRQRSFLYLVEAISWKILDIIKIRDEDSMVVVTNSIFLLILLISVYAIGSILYDRNIGLLSALLTSMFPLVIGHSRVAMTDYPLLCMVSLSMYLLLKTNAFSSVVYSIFSGIVFGVSQFTKETSIVFILPPLIYYFIKAYSSGEKKKVLFNFIITMLFFLIVAGGVFIRTTNPYTFKNYWMQIHHTYNPDLLYYFKSFLIKATGPFIFVLSLPLLLSYLINFKKRNKFLFLWFFIPIILFSISTNKMHRFLLPVLPAFALIVTQELFTDSLFKKLKIALRVIFIPCSILQYAFINSGFLKTEFYKDQFDYGFLSIKKDRYFPVSLALLEAFKKEAVYCRSQKRVLFIFHVTEIVCPLDYKFKLYGLPFCTDMPMNADIVNTPLPGTVNWQENVLTADYIVDKTGFFPGEYKGRQENIADQLREGFRKYRSRFKKIDEIETPDDLSICIYKKIDMQMR